VGFLTGILGLPAVTRFGHFLVVAAGNGVSLDFAGTSRDIASRHYAFLVGEEEFEAAFGRIRDQNLPCWADPGKTRRGAVSHREGLLRSHQEIGGTRRDMLLYATTRP
jgi:hypothetical protein